MTSQSLVMQVIETENIDSIGRLYQLAYKDIFAPSEPQLAALAKITRQALLAKNASRAMHPQGTPESHDRVTAIEATLIDGIRETLGDAARDRFVSIFGLKPLSSMSIGFPMVFDSEEHRAATRDKLGLEPIKL